MKNTKAVKVEPLRYRHFAKVTLRPFGGFPIDMLRYDRCCPHGEVDSSIIEASPLYRSHEPVPVVVMTHSDSSESPWTIQRWDSFTVNIEPISEHDIAAIRSEQERIILAKEKADARV